MNIIPQSPSSSIVRIVSWLKFFNIGSERIGKIIQNIGFDKFHGLKLAKDVASSCIQNSTETEVWIRQQHRGWPVWCLSGDFDALFSQADTRQGLLLQVPTHCGPASAAALRGLGQRAGFSRVLFQSSVSNSSAHWKSYLHFKLPGQWLARTAAMCLYVPIRTIYVIHTYMVFYVQTMYRRVQIVRNTCNLLTFICTWYVHIRANTFTTGRRSV